MLYFISYIFNFIFEESYKIIHIEIAGSSSIDKFDVVVSSNLVIMRSKTLSLLWVWILTFMVFRLKQFNRSRN